MTLRLDRIEREEEVLVDVISCSAQPDLNDTAMACRTVDVSETGMRVATNMEIPVNTVLGLRLDLPDQLYRLEGEVRWSREDESFNVGLLINEQSQDFPAWTKMFQLEF
ncbi:MAG: PilZ domain-containing protein [Pseudomonadales bacterium]